MTGRKRSAAHLRAIAGVFAVTGAILPVSAVAQTTTTDVTDLIKNLQSEIGTIEKRHQGEIGAIQKQYQTEIRNLQKQHQAQIQNLQKQLDELKAAQAAPGAAAGDGRSGPLAAFRGRRGETLPRITLQSIKGPRSEIQIAQAWMV
jgi:TolA-binding protein